MPRHSSSATFARRVQLTVVAGEGPSVQLGTAKLPARSVARSTTHSVLRPPLPTPLVVSPSLPSQRVCLRIANTHPCIDHTGVTAIELSRNEYPKGGGSCHG